jgi:hypothetical protein
MALPIAIETERTLHLRSIVDAATNADINVFDWPRPTDDDLLLFARIIHAYSGIDFLLRWTAEIMDGCGMLAPKWKGKTTKLNMYDLNQAIRSAQIWVEPNLFALREIETHRRTRNLVAHFFARRFPAEDAYVFMTKSAIDFERVHGTPPPEGVMLYCVCDADQLAGIVPVIKGLSSWLSKIPQNLSAPIAQTQLE